MAVVGGVLLSGCGSVIGGQAVPVLPAPTTTSTSTLPSAPAQPAVSSPTPPPTPTQPAPPMAPPPTSAHLGASATSSSVGPADLQQQHDAVFRSLLATATAAVKSGNEQQFLAVFGPATSRTAHFWFRNTRALGVADALFSASDDYSSAATDAPHSFTRTVVLGIRTPFDDTDSMPGIPYAITVSMVAQRGREVPLVTSWQPKYLGDPMACGCTLAVAHSSTIAVVADTADKDLTYWLPSALDAASGITWADHQLIGSGLIAPRGTVIFLTDKPFRWFLPAMGAAQHANVTAGLLTALGDHPGTRYSDQSRIVLMLQSSDGSVVPDDAVGRQYAQDVLTHESTHQLMNRNSTLPERTPTSPPTWVVEGIAVAVETLHRDSLGAGADSDYPEPNDPRNISSRWFRLHLGDQLPTQAQLYTSSAVDGAGFYAIAGSVFRYIDQQYGYATMMSIAKAMYSKPGQSPFRYFPDPATAGGHLPEAAAQRRWHDWFVTSYE